jgi:Holliday junction resolvasome RuvABC endonuclease subunit
MASKPIASTPPLVIGLDPGTGSSSPTGFCLFDPTSLRIHYAANIETTKRELHHRIKEISDVLDTTLAFIAQDHPKRQLLVCIESFVMRGKGGETLQRLIGSFMGRVPYNATLLHVQNTKVKLFIAKHGHASKEDVGIGVLAYFSKNKESKDQIEHFLRNKEADIIDSLAIAATGWEVYKK